MAEIKDIEHDDVSEIDTVAEIDKAQSAESSEVKPESVISEELPERYRGKSVKEIIEIAEKDKSNLGRYANEAGELRRLADELIKSQLKPKAQEEQPPEVDFFENPQEAIRQAVERNPKVLAAEQYAVESQRAQAKMALVQKHPDFANVIQDAEFAEWVKSSKIRTQLYAAAEAFNFDAADELLGTYKALKGFKQKQVTEVDRAVRDQSLKAAAVDTGGSGETTRKVYRRADLIRLKMRDPAKFDAMQDEIDAAYRDGRVK